MHTTDRITKKFVNSKRAYHRFSSFGMLAWLFLPSQIPAQILDSTLRVAPQTLPEFLVQDVRFERTAYSRWKADSLPQHGVIALSDRLLWENPLDVRANAPGTLATISIRGAGPSRSPVFWNGLNLQSPMNGVVDASLLPLWPDDEATVYYGGQSAAQSSGAMGGSMVIEQGSRNLRRGVSALASAGAGSFGRWGGMASLGYGGKIISSNIRASWQQAENDFPFQKQALDGSFYSSKQPNNYGERGDIQQFNQLKLGEKNLLKTAFWHQQAYREIPPATTESPNETWQRDRSNRLLLSWESSPRHRDLWVTRAAYLDDFLVFYLAGDSDTSHSKQLIVSSEYSNQSKKLAWRVGASGLRQWAQADGYADSMQWFRQTRLATYAMNQLEWGRTRISTLLRYEWVEGQTSPFTWSLGGNQGLKKWGSARFHLSRNFNLPTFNDRFWNKLGNPELRPEHGYSADLGWHRDFGNFSAEISGYQLVLDDWILWQPDQSGIFRPNNLRKVWNRGIETRYWVKIPMSNWCLSLDGRAQFSKTTNIAVYDGAQTALGKPLAYTPNFSGGLSLRVSRGIVSAAYLQQFTGERLDNTGKKLPGFSVGNVLASCTFWKNRLALDVRLENLWDVRYEIIRFRPMPGRSGYLGLSWKW